MALWLIIRWFVPPMNASTLTNCVVPYSPTFLKRDWRFIETSFAYRKKKELRQKRYVAALDGREFHENARLLAAAIKYAASIREPLSSATGVVAIPSASRKTAALSPSRIERYTEHLKAIIAEAVNYIDIAVECPEDAGSPGCIEPAQAKLPCPENHASYHLEALVAEKDRFLNDNPALRRVSDKLCALCRGGVLYGGTRPCVCDAADHLPLDESRT